MYETLSIQFFHTVILQQEKHSVSDISTPKILNVCFLAQRAVPAARRNGGICPRQYYAWGGILDSTFQN